MSAKKNSQATTKRSKSGGNGITPGHVRKRVSVSGVTTYQTIVSYRVND